MVKLCTLVLDCLTLEFEDFEYELEVFSDALLALSLALSAVLLALSLALSAPPNIESFRFPNMPLAFCLVSSACSLAWP